MFLSLNDNSKRQSDIVMGSGSLSRLDLFLESYRSRPESVFVLADENTKEHCLPVIIKEVPFLRKAGKITVMSGERSKSLTAAKHIWDRLESANAGRDALLVCLGGGVVTDLGGFAASTYKRGIRFVHVPTSLIGQVDAAIGGKTALNSGGIKNNIGTFSLPEAVYIHTVFLETLPKDHLLSGFAEMLKSGLILDGDYWQKLICIPPERIAGEDKRKMKWDLLIMKAVRLKCQVVKEDFRERDHRELLNYGHTIGHAMESLFNKGKKTVLLHGHAVAAGMICAAYISTRLTGLRIGEMDEIVSGLRRIFDPVPLTKQMQDSILGLIRHDKKNQDGLTRFTLLEKKGKAVSGIVVPEFVARESLVFYNSLSSSPGKQES